MAKQEVKLRGSYNPTSLAGGGKGTKGTAKVGMVNKRHAELAKKGKVK